MKPRLRVATTATWLLLVGGTARETGAQDLARKVDALFSYWNTTETPGAVAAVIHEGAIVYQNSYGMADLERGVPLSTNSVFDIASISKQFTAMSILLLEEQGKLTLDDDIRTHLPNVPDYENTITLRHMVHHTSGLRDYMDLMELAGMPWENHYEQAEIVDLVSRQRALNNLPGDEYLYSNSGYLLLAEVLHKVSGQTLGEFTRRNIFEPLGMEVSHFYDDFTLIVPDRALSYAEQAGGGYKNEQYIFDVIGDTGLLTNVRDLLEWDRNFYDNKLGMAGPALIDRMLVPGKLNNGETIDYAFGLRVHTYRGLRVVRHGGGAAGYSTSVVRFPDQRFTFIVLSNLGEFEATNMAMRIADLYLAEDFTSGPEPTEEPAQTAEPIPMVPAPRAEDLAAYAGRYFSPELQTTYIVQPLNGRLTYHFAYSPVDRELLPTSRDDWHSERTEFTFLRDDNDEVGSLHVSLGRVRNIYFEKTD